MLRFFAEYLWWIYTILLMEPDVELESVRKKPKNEKTEQNSIENSQEELVDNLDVLFGSIETDNSLGSQTSAPLRKMTVTTTRVKVPSVVYLRCLPLLSFLVEQNQFFELLINVMKKFNLQMSGW
jgi:hypothetical protein